MARSSASASASGLPAGSAMGALRRMAAGTIAAMSASREAKPRSESIPAWSFASGPTWRRSKAERSSSWSSVARAAGVGAFVSGMAIPYSEATFS